MEFQPWRRVHREFGRVPDSDGVTRCPAQQAAAAAHHCQCSGWDSSISRARAADRRAAVAAVALAKVVLVGTQLETRSSHPLRHVSRVHWSGCPGFPAQLFLLLRIRRCGYHVHPDCGDRDLLFFLLHLSCFSSINAATTTHISHTTRSIAAPPPLRVSL